jgi:hypothetical protein
LAVEGCRVVKRRQPVAALQVYLVLWHAVVVCLRIANGQTPVICPHAGRRH